MSKTGFLQGIRKGSRDFAATRGKNLPSTFRRHPRVGVRRWDICPSFGSPAKSGNGEWPAGLPGSRVSVTSSITTWRPENASFDWLLSALGFSVSSHGLHPRYELERNRTCNFDSTKQIAVEYQRIEVGDKKKVYGSEILYGKVWALALRMCRSALIRCW